MTTTAKDSSQSSSRSMEFGVSSLDNLTFTKSKIRSDEERILAAKGFQKTLRLTALALALAVSTICAILLAVFWIRGREAPFAYAMVFDAGSSHTEMIIYKWQADKFQGTGVVSQVSSCDMEGGIGVRLRRDPSATAQGYFAQCVSEGLENIPEERRSHSPVYLAATAGMRLVRSESAQEALQIMGNVSRVLERSTDGMLFSVNSVRTISGQEEAVAGWISANYLLRTIFPKPSKIVGMLDMGGASTQITFGRHESAPSSVFDTSLQLYGARHDLYARSYQCFGQDQMLKRYIVLLVQDYFNQTTSWVDNSRGLFRVVSPCHNLGYNFSARFDDVVTVCSRTEFIDELKDVTIMVEGSSSAQQCQKRINSLLDTAYCERFFLSKDCFSTPTSHSPDTNFVAVSGFYYVMDYLGFSKETPSIQDFLKAIQHRCSMTWNDLQAFLPDTPTKYLSLVCFNAQYTSELLLNGYHINEQTWKNISFLRKVNGTSVGWTLGFAIQAQMRFLKNRQLSHFQQLYSHL